MPQNPVLTIKAPALHPKVGPKAEISRMNFKPQSPYNYEPQNRKKPNAQSP